MIHPNWHKHPLVQFAFDAADGDPRELLFHLDEMLNELEDRFPGTPIDTILAAQTEGRQRNLRRDMRHRGTTESDCDLVMGGPAGSEGARVKQYEPSPDARRPKHTDWAN